MSQKTKPAIITYECDRCLRTSEETNFLQMKVEFPGRDYGGNICGPGGTYELCRRCESDLLDFLKTPPKKEDHE